MNNLADPFERGGHHGHVQPEDISPREVSTGRAFTAAEQIEVQLNSSADNFTEALNKYKSGDKSGYDYLVEMKSNLAKFKSLLHINLGAPQEKIRKLIERIDDRQKELEEVLKPSVIH